MTQSIPLVESPMGAFRGTASGGVEVFRGIRYAKPPVGALRWRDPVPAPRPDGVVDASSFGAVAPQQLTAAVNLGDTVTQSEDCLFLNVWRPAGTSADAALPVMVWVHGGAYTFGSGSQPVYDGAALVTTGEVIVVTINYRIGALGFLDLSSFSTERDRFDGNLALKDVIAALRWVQGGIAAFGGDPDRVTVFGESAGGGLVTTLLTVPSARGLVHRVIAESSPVSSAYGPARARAVAERFLAAVAVDAAAPATLRDLPAPRIVEATMRVFADVPGAEPGTIAFAPVIDGDLVPEAPLTALREGRALPLPLLIGTNKDEASAFRYMKSPLLPITDQDIQRMFDDLHAENPALELPSMEQVRAAYEGVRAHAVGLGIARDIGFRMPTLWAVEGHSRIAPVWLYRFDFATPFLQLVGLGATHAAELPYVWGNLTANRRSPAFRLGGRRTAEAISIRMRQRWTAFARGENPDAPDAPSWPPFRIDAPATLVIDRTDRVALDLDADLRAGWGETPLAFD